MGFSFSPFLPVELEGNWYTVGVQISTGPEYLHLMFMTYAEILLDNFFIQM